MKKTFLVLFILLLISALGGIWVWGKDANVDPGNNPIPTGKEDLIRVTAPRANEEIESPLVVRGEARGNWFFEASFPIRLLDSVGNEIAVGIGQAQGDWMTTDFVPFEGKLIFTTPITATAGQIGSTGTIVFQKDNPSGLPENDDELRVPIRFNQNASEKRTIKLFYYNEEKDKDASGNILCSAKGLESVSREVPLTITPLQDAIRLLIEGDITYSESLRGVDTEFPLQGLALSSASISPAGVATLVFADPQNKTGGGSCRVNVLRAQIEATAKQFENVTSVVITPPTLFQP